MNIPTEIEKLKIKEKIISRQNTLSKERELELSEKEEKLKPIVLLFDAVLDEIKAIGGSVQTDRETARGVRWILTDNGESFNPDITKFAEEGQTLREESDLIEHRNKLREMREEFNKTMLREKSYLVGIECLNIKVEYKRATDSPACYEVKFEKHKDWEAVCPISDYQGDAYMAPRGWAMRAERKTLEEAENLIVGHLAHKLRPMG